MSDTAAVSQWWFGILHYSPGFFLCHCNYMSFLSASSEAFLVPFFALSSLLFLVFISLVHVNGKIYTSEMLPFWIALPIYRLHHEWHLAKRQQAAEWIDALCQIFCAASQGAKLRAGSWGASGLTRAAAAQGKHQGAAGAPKERDVVGCFVPSSTWGKFWMVKTIFIFLFFIIIIFY